VYEKSIIGKFLVISIILAFISAVYASCSYCCNESPNTAPERPSVYITPTMPTTQNDLYCYAYSYDADHDEIRYYYRWYKNGALFRTYTTKSNYTYISHTYTSTGEEWKCVVKAFDGKAYSTENYDSVRIVSEYACEDFELSVPTRNVSLRTNDKASISFWVKNHGNVTQCIKLSAKDYSAYINATVSKASVCLNPNESKLVALTIETNNASAGSYTVKVRAEGSCLVREEEITVSVEEACCTAGISLVPIRGNICKGKKGTVSVLVKNLTNRMLNVKLDASSTGFAARFEKSELELDSRQEVYVNLEVYGEGSLGEHYIDIYARADSYYVKRRAYFRLVECPETPSRIFSLEVPAECISLEKLQDKNVAFTIKNLTGLRQAVNIQTVSDILSETDNSITLQPHEKKMLYVKVYARDQDKPGKHYIKIYAWKGSYREKKELCVEVKPLRKSAVILADNDIEIEQCSFGLFVLTIENRGDTEESYKISVNNATQASIKVSDESFSLQPHEGKEVFITVNVPVDMPLGNYSADIVIENESIWVKTIYFTVIEPAMPEEVVEARPMIVSYPTTISIFPGEERIASLVLYNPSTESIDVSIEFELPEGFYSPKRSFTLEPGASKTIVNNVRAYEDVEPGQYYYGKIIMRYDDTVIEKPIKFYVEKPEEKLAAATGFFGIGTSLTAGLIILIAFAVIIFLLKLTMGGPKKAEIMLYRR
jgi:uncharacterized membrane protein